MTELRPQCAACPWRDVAAIEAEMPWAVEAAREGKEGWVCHTRCGPCDGPRYAGLLGSGVLGHPAGVDAATAWRERRAAALEESWALRLEAGMVRP